MTKEIFVAIVENLKKNVAQDLQIDNALNSVGLYLNRDNYVDYFWEAANDIFCNYFDDASIEMIFDYCIGETIHINTAGGNEIIIESAGMLYEHCGTREEQERREYEEETYYSSMI